MRTSSDQTTEPAVGEILAAARSIGELFSTAETGASDTHLAAACELIGDAVHAEVVAVRSVGADNLLHFAGGWATSPILDDPQPPLRLKSGANIETPVLTCRLEDMPIELNNRDVDGWREFTPTQPQTLFCPVRSGSQTLGYVCLVAPKSVVWTDEAIDVITLAACVIGQYQLRVRAEQSHSRRIELTGFLRTTAHLFYGLNPGEQTEAIEEAIAALGRLVDASTASLWRLDQSHRVGERLLFWSDESEMPRVNSVITEKNTPIQFKPLREPQIIGTPEWDTSYVLAPGLLGTEPSLCLALGRTCDRPWEDWELQDIAAFADHIALVRHKLAIEARLAATFNDAPRGISLRSMDGSFIDCNPAYLDFLGLSSKEEVARFGLRLMQNEFTPADVVQLLEQQDFAALDGNEIAYTRPDGTIVWGRVSVVKIGSGASQAWLTHVEDVTSHREALEVIRYRAATDSLTGTANRHAIGETLETILSSQPRLSGADGDAAASCAVVLLDLDGFKAVNDGHGHQAGDQVLFEVGRRLSRMVRPGDLVGRYGGDEFVVVQKGPVLGKDAIAMTQRIRSCFDTPIDGGGRVISVGASVGMALALTDDTPDSLLARADTAMYNEKFESRLRRTALRDAASDDLLFPVRAARPALDKADRRIGGSEVTPAQLDAALRKGEIVFWGQPIVHVPTGAPLGIELLARWPQRDGSMISPASFIPCAERSGLVVELGRQALAMGARLLHRWSENRQFRTLGVNVNISPLHLAHGLIEDVHAMVPELPPDAQLGLEFIETSLADESREHLRALDSLVNRGIRVIIDDFGIGHSSLSRLQQFPASNLKLDKSFITDIADNDDRRRFFGAIVRLLASANYPVTVEGVETEEQMALVRRGHAQAAQGYHVARPAPVDHMEHVLQELFRSATPAVNVLSSVHQQD